MIEGFYFAKVNLDGLYSDPVKIEAVKNITITSDNEKKPDHTIDMFNGDTVTIEIEMDYKKRKEFVWNVLLNLKRCKKRLVSKNYKGR